MPYKITLTTVASITVTVQTDDEDRAVDVAYERGREFAGYWHSGPDWTADINDEWQLREPEIVEVSDEH